MRYHEIIASLVEEETITAWVNITALPEPEKKVALAAFNKLAQDQRGLPEQMGAAGGDINKGIHNARGIYEYLTEHVGDLTNRMAKAFHVEDQHCGYDYVGRKVDACLRAARHRFGMEREIKDQFLQTYERAVEQGLTQSLAGYKRAWEAAGRRYAEAHAKLVVYNAAQYHAREAAVALGNHHYEAMTTHLSILESHLSDETDWANWAGLVRLDASKRPIPFRTGLSESAIAEAPERYRGVVEPGSRGKWGKEITLERPIRAYHATHEAVGLVLKQREIRTYDSMGTWLTSNPDMAKMMYGPNVGAYEVPAGRYLFALRGWDMYYLILNQLPTIERHVSQEAADYITKWPWDAKNLAFMRDVRKRTGELQKKNPKLGLEDALQELLYWNDRDSYNRFKKLQGTNKYYRQVALNKDYCKSFRDFMVSAQYKGIIWNGRHWDGSPEKQTIFLVFEHGDLHPIKDASQP